jgi:hypothetical protein
MAMLFHNHTNEPYTLSILPRFVSLNVNSNDLTQRSHPELPPATQLPAQEKPSDRMMPYKHHYAPKRKHAELEGQLEEVQELGRARRNYILELRLYKTCR